MLDLDPRKRLGRKELADALTDAGYPLKHTTLQTMAARGEGPPYEKFGRAAIYTWGLALEWAKSRSVPCHSFSEHKAQHAETKRPRKTSAAA